MDVMSLSCGIDNSRFYWFLFLFFYLFFSVKSACMYVCSSMRINSPSLQSLCQMWALHAIILRRGVKRLIVLWALRCEASEQIAICVKWSVSRWGKTVTYAVVFCAFFVSYTLCLRNPITRFGICPSFILPSDSITPSPTLVTLLLIVRICQKLLLPESSPQGFGTEALKKTPSG